jgi:hypothetical protein
MGAAGGVAAIAARLVLAFFPITFGCLIFAPCACASVTAVESVLVLSTLAVMLSLLLLLLLLLLLSFCSAGIGSC